MPDTGKERRWIARWRLFRVFVGLPIWLLAALREGSVAFIRAFRSEWADRPRHSQAKAAYEQIVEGRYR
jgi:hypothetical protein